MQVAQHSCGEGQEGESRLVAFYNHPFTTTQENSFATFQGCISMT